MFRQFCIIAIVLLVSTAAPAQNRLPYFRFDFEDGRLPTELEFGRSPRFSCEGCVVQDGSFVIPRQNSLLETSFVLLDQHDFVVNTQVRFLENSGKVDWASMKVRDPDADDANSPGYFAGISSLGELRIQGGTDVGQFDPNSLASLPNTGLNPFDNDISLRFAVDGPKLSLTAWNVGEVMPGTPQLVLDDDRYLQSSYVAFSNSSFNVAPGATVAFRYMEATPLPAANPTADILLVVPNELEHVEGTNPTAVSGPFRDGFRIQEWYPAEQFESLPPTHRLITGFRFRPDASVTEPTTVTNERLITLSTVSTELADLGDNYDDNRGPDAKVVFDGSWTYSTEASGPPDGPRDFDIVLDFDKPFHYDPSQGNLLVEVTRAPQNHAGVTWDSHNLFGESLLGTTNANATTIEGAIGGTVTQFVFAPTGVLQAGDANQDLQFDQRDLVQVQIAGKYLTGTLATWGEGDWDGAPGGRLGAPPDGDGIFNHLDVIAALGADVYLTGPYSAVEPGGELNDGQTSLIYHVATGELAVDAPAGTELTSINIDSASGVFTGTPAENLGGSFDNDADANIFKATFGSSFDSLSFGNVVQPGLSPEFLRNDLTVIGSLAGGGDLWAVDLIYVPETTGWVLLIMGCVGVAALPARRLLQASEWQPGSQ